MRLGIISTLALLALLSGVLRAGESASYSIETKGGAAKIVRDGETLAPDMLFVNLHDRPKPESTALMAIEIDDAAKRGVDIVTFTVGLPWPREGAEPDFYNEADKWIDAVLAVNPKALLIPRIPATSPPKWWQDANPGEMNLFDDGSRSACASAHSRKWREDAAKHVKALVAHLEARYGGNIMGYHPSGHNTGEWISEKLLSGTVPSFEPCAAPAFREFLARKYGSDDALSAAWGAKGLSLKSVEPPAKEKRVLKGPPAFRQLPAERDAADFAEFRNDEMADALLAICGAIKGEAPKKLVLAFYGYQMELARGAGLQDSGHLAEARLLASSKIDILCSPVSYMDRYGGGSAPFMAPVDSAPLHGKMRLLEDDLRTHLSPAASLEAKINGHPKASDARETYGILTRNFGLDLAHGAGIWWMDLWGEGWYRGDEMWSFLGKLHEARLKSLEKPSRPPEIAVFLDARSQLLLRPHSKDAVNLFGRFRQDLFRLGAPCAFYALDDLLSGKAKAAKLNIVLDAFSMDSARLAKLERIEKESQASFLWFWAPGFERDGAYSAQNASNCCGLELEALPPQSGSGKALFAAKPEELYDAGNGPLGPSFKVVDPKAETLAKYADGSGAAVAIKRNGRSFSAYSGILRLPPWLLRSLAKEAGAHIYNEQGDIVSAGFGYAALHAASDGAKKLEMPEECKLKDALSGELFGPARSFEFQMRKGDSRLLETIDSERSGGK